MTDAPSPQGSLRAILARTPTALFPMVLGVAGAGAALRAAGVRFEASPLASAGVMLVIAAGLAWVTAFGAYGAKLVIARDAARHDFTDPNSANLLAPACMATMVLGAQLAAVTPIGGVVWLAGLTAHGVLLTRLVGDWLTSERHGDLLNPTWFLPAAGIMTGAMTAPVHAPPPLLTTAGVESLGWIAFAAGLFLWLSFLPAVLHRVMFEPAFPPRLRPSLFILAAPPGLAANAVMNLAPQAPTALAQLPIYFAVLIIAALLTRPRFLASTGLHLSWWATTFPLATVAAALSGVWVRTGAGLDAALALIVLGLATGFVGVALWATGRLAWRTCLGETLGVEGEIAAMSGEMD